MANPLRIGILGPVSLQTIESRIPTYKPATNGLGSPVITELALALSDRGHEVSVFTLSNDRRDLGRFAAERLSITVEQNRRRHRARNAFRNEIRSLTTAIEADPPDVLHAHWTYEFAIAAMKTGLPTLVTVRDWAPTVLRHHPHPYRVVRLGMQHWVLNRAEHLSANSPYIAGRIKQRLGVQVPVIPNGIAVPRELPSRPSRSRDRLVLGSVNNGFGRLKNVGALLTAFSLVRGERPDAVLRLVGMDFETGGPAHQWARRRGLDIGVRFEGPVSNDAIPGFMRDLDMLVHPSLEESFGSIAIEAIVEGTLVIGGANSGAVPWVLGEGAAGVLVDVGDPGAIARAVVQLDGDRAAWPGRRHHAVDHVRRNFSLDSVVSQYESLYRGLLVDSDVAPRGPGSDFGLC